MYVSAKVPTIQALDMYFLLLFCKDGVVITSEMSQYNRLTEGVAECQYTDIGKIMIENYAETLKNADFW